MATEGPLISLCFICTQSLCIFIGAASKFAQLQHLWKTGDSGAVSALTWGLASYAWVGGSAGGPGGCLVEAGAAGWTWSCAVALSNSQTSLETWSFAIVIGEGA